jgi:competence ComEA-like helix-hairpin-helix protein
MKFFNRHIIQSLAIFLISICALFFHILLPKFSLDYPTAIDEHRVAIDGFTQAQRFILGLPIDVNAATPDDLVILPGIGPKTAVRIVAERGKNGPYKSIDDLLRIKGITKKKLLVLKPFLEFSFARQEAFQTPEMQIGRGYGAA